ncbi:hypothetical protein IMG5_195870 [Ichthyophthirius multifiliis]|uniref:Ribosomal protein L1 n=1 Tax=Ichthyophthirius multifiliis TaxID=5932 RepID=G0R503_ICHMU|nr:hypothetical protein IMG5_195870 [Ichthyophthirius multifiliis]EGR27405.1 hypothetical protein IMG5_195870 [Ichthyophthirius multifiliis]|eukprot:XP_004024312.1 hypothetical protein IMG5_195870 [Ichthyophthirius multifiliis]
MKTLLPNKTKKIKKTIVNPLIKDYSLYVSQENAKYQKLRKSSIKHIKLDKNLIKKAAKELINFYTKSKQTNNLLDLQDDFIYIEIILSQIPENYSIRPLQISLPVPIYGKNYNTRFCIFSKDPQRDYKEKIKDLDIPCIEKIIGYSKIDKKYPTYKDKLKLFYSYDMFFVDYTIYDLIRKPTGKVFYQRKKIPYPINSSKVPAPFDQQFGQDYQAYLNSLTNYTYFSMGNGPVYTIKVARTNMNIPDIVKNVIHSIYNAVPHLVQNKNLFEKVRQINIKTYSSVSLPIFNQLSKEEIQSIAN